MFNFSSSEIINMLLGVPAIIIAMVIHEYAHAIVADYLGDSTPRYMGRLTLNPMAHIDWFGFIALFIAHIGWAKPVLINPNNFKNIKLSHILVSIAGPLSNLLVATLGLFAIYIFAITDYSLSPTGQRVLTLIVLYNVNFAIFNILPIPPLDGSRILTTLLPYSWQEKLANIEHYSIFLFILLINFPGFQHVFHALQKFVLGCLAFVVENIVSIF